MLMTTSNNDRPSIMSAIAEVRQRLAEGNAYECGPEGVQRWTHYVGRRPQGACSRYRSMLHKRYARLAIAD
jgi:hypothetical protein